MNTIGPTTIYIFGEDDDDDDNILSRFIFNSIILLVFMPAICTRIHTHTPNTQYALQYMFACVFFNLICILQDRRLTNQTKNGSNSLTICLFFISVLIVVIFVYTSLLSLGSGPFFLNGAKKILIVAVCLNIRRLCRLTQLLIALSTHTDIYWDESVDMRNAI